MDDFPDSVRVVVIGGGIVGCSVAYHLGRLGIQDVVVLERNRLTSGSTWHAAGLVGQLRTNANVTQLLGYSVDLYHRLEAETGLATGWKRNGGLRLACNPERWVEVKRQATTARSFGLDMHLLSPPEAQELWPLMAIDDIVGAAYLPTDGQANPADITQALAKGARDAGIRIWEETETTGFEIESGRIRGVMTNRGRIECGAVICCAGQWSRSLGKLAGVNIPLVSVQHQYVVTEQVPGVTPDLPTLRDPDRLLYYKEEVGGLALGGYEPNPLPWAQTGVPDDFAFSLLDSDWEHFSPLMTEAIARVPALEHVGVRQLINGPESFTPDGNFILGESPEVEGFYVGAGFNAFGIAAAGGAGMALAEWVAEGSPPYDLWPVDITRFGPNHADTNWVRTRTLEAYAKHYTMAWPFEEHESGRPLRRSPLYQSLKDQGAVFGEKLGFERPNWFAGPEDEPRDLYTYGRQNWFAAVGREHTACRNDVVVFDQTSFAKFSVVGDEAGTALSWICAGDVNKPVGGLTYTQLLNGEGGIECDLTVARLGPDRFHLTTGTGFATHDYAWISRHLPIGVQLIDVTSAYAVLSVMGPRSRDVIAACTSSRLDNEAFPFATTRRLELAGAPVLALRITYVGELGYELHIPIDFALTVYERLLEAGAAFSISNAGYRAIESLRLEKGYRAWGSDIGPDHTPLMAGLGWATKLKTDQPFLGRLALEDQATRPLPRLFCGFTIDDPEVILLGRETIYRNDQKVGWLTSAGYGYTVGQNIGYGYVRDSSGVDPDYVMAGDYELEVATERVPAQPFLRALYDPAATRIKS